MFIQRDKEESLTSPTNYNRGKNADSFFQESLEKMANCIILIAKSVVHILKGEKQSLELLSSNKNRIEHYH